MKMPVLEKVLQCSGVNFKNFNADVESNSFSPVRFWFGWVFFFWFDFVVVGFLFVTWGFFEVSKITS